MRTQMKNPAKKSEKLVAIIQCQSFWCLFFQNSEIDKITIPVNLRVCDITFFFSLFLFLFISQFCIYYPVLVDVVQHFNSTLPFFVHIQLIIQRWAHTKNLHRVYSLFLVIVFIFNGLRLHKQQHKWIECQPYNGLKVKLDRWAWSL